MVELIQKFLKDEIELVYGKGLPKNTRKSGIYPVYGSNGIVDYSEAVCFEGPGIIIGRKGTVGSIKYEQGNFWAIDTTYIVSLKDINSDLKFWYYFLKTLGLEKMNSHTAVPGLNRDRVYNIKINIPKHEEDRKKISRILSDIDSKIELNNNITDNLQQLTQELYKRWFVDFEFPNEAGKPYKFSGGKITDGLPVGWKYGKINDVTKELKQRIRDDYENAVVMSPVKTGELVKSDDFFNKQVYSKEINNYKKICYLDFAYNPSRVNIGSIGILKDRVIGAVSPVYVTFRSKEKYHWYISMLIKEKDVQNKIIQYSSGSVRQSLKYVDFSNIECIVPDEYTIDKFNEFYEEIEKQKTHNLKQNKKLVSIRDILLQKLINGEIDLDKIAL